MKEKLKRLVKTLSLRQVAGLAVLALVCAGVAVAAVGGQAEVATCLLAVLLAGACAGVVHLSRRIGGVNRSTQTAVRDLRLVVEQLQRRVIASVERERLAAGDRHLELTEVLARTERLTSRGAELLLRDQAREVESLFQLFQRVTPRAPMPSGSTLTPSDLLGLVHIASQRKPGLTVTLGSGPSTVWLAYALQPSGGRVVAIDHDPIRAEGTQAMLVQHGLADALVRHAPLAELTVGNRTVDWYDVEALAGLQEIDLLIVDGSIAPQSSDPLAPALHVLGRRLAPDAAVVVDEAPGDHAVPRQGGGFPLIAERRLAGRWTTLALAPA